MRQPEVARLSALLLALVLVIPVIAAGRDLLVAGAFLVEFLTGGARPALSRLTAPPRRLPLAVVGAAADRYVSPALRRPPPLVLVHGFTPEGKDDPRARRAAELLARAGFEVAVPTVPGLTLGRLRPGDVEAVAATIDAMSPPGSPPVTVVGVSLGAGPALLAAADPRVRDRVATVVSLGGYGSASELLRFFLTGDYGFAGVRGHVTHDPAAVRAFVEANADLADEASRRRLASGDREFARAFLAAPSPELRALLDALSPERVAADIRARLVLVHGRSDPAVPYTESLRLAAARPARTTLALVGAVGHVEGTSSREEFHDLVTLLGVAYRLVAGA